MLRPGSVWGHKRSVGVASLLPLAPLAGCGFGECGSADFREAQLPPSQDCVASEIVRPTAHPTWPYAVGIEIGRKFQVSCQWPTEGEARHDAARLNRALRAHRRSPKRGWRHWPSVHNRRTLYNHQ
jgi:hypothetical protein